MDSLNNIWVNFNSEIVSFVLALLLALITFIFRGKVKLIWGQANKSWHSVPVDTGTVSIISEKHFAQNMGRVAATNVEVVYTVAPTKLTVFPQRDYNITTNPDGAHIVTIPYISPKELVSLDAIYVGIDPGQILSVGCKEQEGKLVPFFVVRQFTKNVYIMIWCLLFFGVVFLISILIKAMFS
jgi:hypothetical protein